MPSRALALRGGAGTEDPGPRLKSPRTLGRVLIAECTSSPRAPHVAEPPRAPPSPLLRPRLLPRSLPRVLLFPLARRSFLGRGMFVDSLAW